MTAPTAVLDQALDQATREILAVTATLTGFVQRHRLPLHTYSLRGPSPAARRFNPATRRFDRPVIPRVEVSTSSGDLPGAFLAWCQALSVDEVAVERRANDLVLTCGTDHAGIEWHVYATVPRPDRGSPCLPGANIRWEQGRNGAPGRRGTVTVRGLRVAVTELRDTTPTT